MFLIIIKQDKERETQDKHKMELDFIITDKQYFGMTRGNTFANYVRFLYFVQGEKRSAGERLTG